MTVFLQGRKSVLGPLRAYPSGLGDLCFAPVNAANAETLRIPTDAFRAITRMVSCVRTAQHFAVQAPPEEVELRLARFGNAESRQLRDAGQVHFVPSDAQVLNWAIRTYELRKASVAPLKEIAAKVASSELVTDDARVLAHRDRLARIVADAEGICTLGAEVAESLARLDLFAPLIDSHVDRLAGERVTAEVQRRLAELEQQRSGEMRALQLLQESKTKLQAECERQTEAIDRAFRDGMAQRIADLEEREAHLDAREAAVREQEARVAERLSRITERYETEGTRVADDLLAVLPILRKIGLLPGGGGGTGRDFEFQRVSEYRFPEFLNEAVPPEGPSEADFLEQFRQTVVASGYAFSEEDLLNFHVNLKIGGLLVLNSR